MNSVEKLDMEIFDGLHTAKSLCRLLEASAASEIQVNRQDIESVASHIADVIHSCHGKFVERGKTIS